VAKGLWLSPDSRADLIDRASRRPGGFTGEEAKILPGNPRRIVIDENAGIGAAPDPFPEVADPFPRPRLALVSRNGNTIPAPDPVPVPAGPVSTVTGIPRQPATRSRPVRTRDLDERVWAEVPEAHQGGIGGTDLAAQLQAGRSQVQGAFKRLEAEGRIRNAGNGKWVRA
jgi:hypothetical protein